MKHTCSQYPRSDIERRPNYSRSSHCPWIFLVWRPLELSRKKKSMVEYRSDIVLREIGYFLVEIIAIRESMMLTEETIFRVRSGMCIRSRYRYVNNL